MSAERRRLVAAASLSVLILAADSGRAQVQREDPARGRARAQRAQHQFESYRRRQLPVTGVRSGASECDVRIGRFCYWHDDAGDPPPEPDRVAAAREAFLRTLDSLGPVAATDAWVVGQRVRYLVEANRAADALRAASTCTASAWWCAALTGFAQHALGAYDEADRTFVRALGAMPEAQRCRWTDLSDLLPDGFRKAYRSASCDQRDSINAHVWWLADPRWGSSGNDLRTEVYSRLTMAELVRQARSAHDMAWGQDMHELMLRYGWPTAWSRTWPSSTDPTRIVVIGHEPSPSFEFMPDARALRDPLAAEAASWTPTAPRPLTRYAPAYAQRYRGLEPQVAWFARSDSAAVVVAYEVGDDRDTVFARDSVQAAVAISRHYGDGAVAQTWRAAHRSSFVVPTSWAPTLASVEIVDSARRAFGRARWTIAPPPDSAMSDLLLLDGASGLPASFDGAVERALGTLTVSRREPFGVYWELYGDVAHADSLSYSVTVQRRGASWLRRLVERARLAERPQPVSIGFDDRPGRSGAVSARSLLVNVSHIPPGQYRLTLTVQAGEQVVSRQRDIAVK